MTYVDLHVHTTASDGSFSPAEVTALAAAKGLSAIAVTDHDTVSGLGEAIEAGIRYQVEIVPGIEISTKFHGAVHILGYYLRPDSPALKEVLEWVVHDRDLRNEKICKRMREDGLPVEYASLKARFGEVVGRPHFARLLTELGLAGNVQDAFCRYLEKGKRYFEGRNFLSMERSVKIIREAAGIPVLAHPFQYRLDDKQLRELIEYGISCGMLGMECLYTGYSEEQRTYLLSLAAEYGLIPTGGSDFHGMPKPHITLGNADVPFSFLQSLKNAAGR
ncbi:MAG: PHP domain-containing protein [Oscillospiraceae bacterium]|nr:PHP domain-containing protein [Oscillospiraceae bacterium]